MPPAAPTPPQPPIYGFVIPLADEGPVQLESCLGFLRSAYPDAPVVVVSDGVADPGYDRACQRHRARHVPGAFLKRIECGGAWWKRVFEEGLATGARWIVKLDADARICRPFRAEPRYGIAGTIEGAGTDLENVQGGCEAIHHTVARRFLELGLPDDPALASHDTLARDKDQWRSWNARAYFCSDKALFWMARQAGVAQGEWPEVCSRFLPPAADNHDLRYAATHPHKFEPDPRFQGAGLRVITTCRGRLEHLKQTLPRWLAEPGVSVTVVDYGCPDGTADWVLAHHPEVQVVRVTGVARFNLSRARNLGAAHAPGGWWCFWDADCLCEPGWADAIRRSLRHRRYLLADPIEWGQFGSVVVHSYDYRAAGGYDENFRAWGSEDSDFYLRLRHVGIRPGQFPGRVTHSIPHDEAARTAHYDVKKVTVSRDFYNAYIARKRDYMLSTGKLPDAPARRRFLAETCDALGLGPDAPFRPDADPSPAPTVRVHEPGTATPPPPPAVMSVYGDGTATATAVDHQSAADKATATANASATATATAGPAGSPGASPLAAMAPPAPAPAGTTSGPMMTVSLKANDASLDWSIDIGHLVEQGLRSPARDRQPVALHHVGR